MLCSQALKTGDALEDKHFLKRITLLGFKSFVDKTELVFEPGITSIVGPNGCGKSNISDGLRWVLGEQNPRLLRASKMEDLIFNGTKTVPPMNLSELSVVFSNFSKILPIDYDEVTITRKLFRAGESEYWLNGTVVRLRDIEQLLAGTGIGASAYSFMDQGRMAQIIESKPESRRVVFEEAAGITMYETKRSEAERKLIETEDNILRINDIITEVNRQLNSIQRQVVKAQRYKEEFETLRSMEVKLATHKGLLLMAQRACVKDKAEQILAQIKAKSDELKKSQEDEEKLKNEFFQLEQKLANTKAEQIALQGSILSAQEKINTNKEWSDKLNSSNLKILSDIESLGVRKDALESQISEIIKKKEQTKLDIANIETEISSVADKEKTIIDQFEAKQSVLKQLKEKIFELQTKRANLRNEYLNINAKLNELGIRLQRYRADTEQIQKQKDTVLQNIDTLGADIEKINIKIQKAQVGRDGILSQIQIISTEKKNKAEKLLEYEKRHSASISKTEMLKTLEKDHQGYKSGVKAVLDEVDAGRLSNIKGTLAQYMQAREGFEKAVESQLEEIAKFLICKDIDTALIAAQILKQKDLGKATFILSDSIDPSLINDNMQIQGACRFTSCIQVPEEMEKMFKEILKDVWCVKNIEEAKNILKDCPDMIKLVTLDGDIITRYTITTGSLNISDISVIGRQARLSQAEKETSQIEHSISEMKSQIFFLTDKENSLNKEISGFTEMIRQKSERLAHLLTVLNIAKQNMEKITQEQKIIETDIVQTQEEAEQIKTKNNILNSDISKIESELKTAENQLLDAEKSIQQINLSKQEIAIHKTKIEGHLANLKNQEKHFFETVHVLQKSLETENHSLQDKTAEIEQNKTRIEDIRNNNFQLEQELWIFRQKENDFLKILSEKEDSKNKAGQSFEENSNMLQNIRNLIEDLKNQERDVEIEIIQIDKNIETIKMHIEGAYHIEIDLTGRDTLEHLDQIATQIGQSKERIAQMGQVHMGAIEENRELKERFDFLTQQHDDLVQSKDSLLKTIEKIDKTAKEMFTQTFEKVREHFKTYFGQLFGGGEADIFLLDPANSLISGIEIVARPPGKKLQSIALLSGGEKALTAVSLLFAIFKVKPSPFCILDEIDAPLDESNIGRFIKLLKDFVRDSQFLIITHNKKTIEIADVIYGVTMAEHGISKVVSVKFKK